MVFLSTSDFEISYGMKVASSSFAEDFQKVPKAVVKLDQNSVYFTEKNRKIYQHDFAQVECIILVSICLVNFEV